MRKRRDTRTGDLFAYNQPVQRFEEQISAAATLNGRICRAISAALATTPYSRDEIASRMSAYLGERISKSMLDKYASEGSEDHIITLPRFLALVHATDDKRLLNLLTEPFGFISVPRECEGWIKAGMLIEEEERIKRQLDATREERMFATRLAKGVR